MFKFGVYITSHRRTNPMDFGEYQINSFFFFFFRRTKKNSYTLRPMESNSSKCSSIQMMHSIQLKFDTYIIGYRLTYCVKSDEFKINIFFTGVQKRILIHYGA